MDYSLYHDESKEGGYWHGMLLVPVDNKDKLASLLEFARRNVKYLDPIYLKKLGNPRNRKFLCAEAWIQIAIGGMRRKISNTPYFTHYGCCVSGKPQYVKFNDCLGLKFILFRSIDNHQNMELLESHADKIETTFRIGLKGGINYLGDINDTISIHDVHFDGHQHYGRKVDYERIIVRIIDLRSYCGIPSCSDLIHDHPSDHRDLPSDEYVDCQLLQLTDLLVGAFRLRINPTNQRHHILISKAVSYPIDAYKRGYKGYRNSRWFGSFWMSQCAVKKGSWKFSTLEYQPVDGPKQLSMKFQ